MSSRPQSSTHGASYFCDQIAYGLGIFASLGLGGGQAYQMITQGASSQGWTGVAGITGLFAVSSFAIIRRAQLQGSQRNLRSDVEREPLLRKDVKHIVIPEGLVQKVDEWFQELGLREATVEKGPAASTETSEQKIQRQLEAISTHYKEKDRAAQAAQVELEKHRQQQLPTDSSRRKLFDTPASEEVDPKVTIHRLERTLEDMKRDLASAKVQIASLEDIIEEYQLESGIREKYVDQLQDQFEQLLARDTSDSTQKLAITSLLASLKSVGSRHSSARSTPSKETTTPIDSRKVRFDEFTDNNQ